MNGLRKILIAGVTTLLATGCASTPNVYSNADRNVDFSQYKTYGFFQNLSTDKGQYQSLVSSFLKVSVAKQMDRRGLEYADEPQILVNFYINTKDKIRTTRVPTAGGYYGYRHSFYDPWAGYGGYETRVDQHTEGTLNIDVIDAKTKKLVWEGAIVGRVRDEHVRNLEATIDKAAG